MQLTVQKWAQLICSSLLSALPPLSSASALLGAPPRSAGTEHCMLASNAMRAFHWSSATRFGAIFFLGPVVFLLWPLLYLHGTVLQTLTTGIGMYDGTLCFRGHSGWLLQFCHRIISTCTRYMTCAILACTRTRVD